ncbi:MAG: hypothetical protein ACOX8M_09265 [Marvinbryantia sp.]|jgi:hypothetical protein
MKRVLAAAITGTMILAAGMQAGAAPSVTGGGAQQGNIPAGQVVEQAEDLNEFTVEPLEEGTVIWEELDPENYTEEELEVINQLNEAEEDMSLKEAFGDLVDLTEMKLFVVNGDESEAEAAEIEQLLSELRFLSPVWELKFDGIEPTKEKPVLCTFTANNLTEDMEVYVLFNCKEDGWELLETEKTEDNQVEVLIHSVSGPAALVYRMTEETEDAAGTSPVAAETETETETEAVSE